MVRDCFFSPLVLLHFFLDFFWLMLHTLQNLESVSWFSSPGCVYVSTSLSYLLLFKVIGNDFVGFCWAVTIWKVMTNLCYFSEIHLLMWTFK